VGKGRHVISASEIGQYVYCPRAWWLARVEGRSSENIEQLTYGQNAHHRHGRAVWAVRAWQRAAYALIGAGLLAGLLLMIASLLAGGLP